MPMCRALRREPTEAVGRRVIARYQMRGMARVSRVVVSAILLPSISLPPWLLPVQRVGA